MFPWVGERVLQDVLPYLTYVSVFSYRAGPDGSLSDMDASAVLEAAGKAGTAPVMTVTNIREGAGFSSGLAHDILTDEGTQITLIGNISKTMKAKGYRVLNLDFEYLYPEDRENYVAFLGRTAAVLRPQGYTVSVALAPKTSADQPGLLYEAHDYAALGAAAAAPDPLEREKLIDRIRWRKLEELEAGHEFDFDALCVYRLKLEILGRYRRRSAETGRTNFNAAAGRVSGGVQQ